MGVDSIAVYEIQIEKSEHRKYQTMPEAAQERISDVLHELANRPEPSSHSKAEPLSGPHTSLFRVRIGDYRILCDKHHNELRVHRLGKRSQVYRNVDELYSGMDA